MQVPRDLVELERNYLDCWKPPPKIIIHSVSEAIAALDAARDPKINQHIRSRTLFAVQLWLSKLVN